MPAVPYVTLNDFADNMRYLASEQVGMELVVAAIFALQVANPAWAVISMSPDEINTCLRKLTGMTVATGTDLNCYPRGDATAICFDLDGNEVP